MEALFPDSCIIVSSEEENVTAPKELSELASSKKSGSPYVLVSGDRKEKLGAKRNGVNPDEIIS